jgi:ABC-type polysaccharide/polyol phosphate export systems, permease component
VKKEIKLKYRRSYLGVLWTLLEPLLTTIVLTIVFGTLFQRKDPAFPVYILTGRLAYSFYSESTKAAMRSIRKNAGMIKKVYVPKYIYPLSNIISSFVTFLLSLIVLIGAMAVFNVPFTLYLFEAIIPLTILFIMSLGSGLILATLAVFFRDLEYLWGVLLMLIMYCCAIFYPVDGKYAKLLPYLKWNPLFAVIYNFRDAVLYHHVLDSFTLIYSFVFSIITLILGLFVFYKNQDKFILNI